MSLSDDIKDIIYDEIPVNITCSHCEREQNIDSVLPPYEGANSGDKRAWDKMVAKILQAVVNSVLSETVHEADDFRGLSR